LKHQSLDNFNPPVGDKELSFIKSCRFVDPHLSADGIVTTGWLWTLGKVIHIRKSTLWVQFEDPKEYRGYGLNKYQRWRLLQLAFELKFRGHKSIAKDIHRYLDEDINSNGPDDLPSKQYMDLMAEEVVDAIKNEMPLQLACLTDELAKPPYRGVFVPGSRSLRNCLSQSNKSYVFTAWSPTRSDDRLRKRKIDKIVSLEVSLDRSTRQDLPRLRTKQWINGLCFFDRCSPEQVAFPWPSSLEG
jgi:hypothetical protein